MIIKMAKVEIVGPKELLLATLELLRGEGVFHPEADLHGFVSAVDEARIKELLLDESNIRINWEGCEKAVGEFKF